MSPRRSRQEADHAINCLEQHRKSTTAGVVVNTWESTHTKQYRKLRDGMRKSEVKRPLQVALPPTSTSSRAKDSAASVARVGRARSSPSRQSPKKRQRGGKARAKLLQKLRYAAFQAAVDASSNSAVRSLVIAAGDHDVQALEQDGYTEPIIIAGLGTRRMKG